MNKRFIAARLLACSLACSIGAAEAAGGDWGGFYVDGALGARSTTSEIDTREFYSYEETFSPGSTFSFTATTSADDDVGATNFLGQVSAGWRWENDKIVVGLGAFFDIAGDDAGSARAVATIDSSFSGSSSSAGKFRLTQNNRWGLSIDIGPNWKTEPYAKLAYAWSDLEYKESVSCTAGFPAGFKFSDSYSGFAVGGGVRHAYSDNLYFFAEAMWQDLGSKSHSGIPPCGISSSLPAGATEQSSYRVEVSPSNVTGVVGIGWRF